MVRARFVKRLGQHHRTGHASCILGGCSELQIDSRSADLAQIGWRCTVYLASPAGGRGSAAPRAWGGSPGLAQRNRDVVIEALVRAAAYPGRGVRVEGKSQ